MYCFRVALHIANLFISSLIYIIAPGFYGPLFNLFQFAVYYSLLLLPLLLFKPKLHEKISLIIDLLLFELLCLISIYVFTDYNSVFFGYISSIAILMMFNFVFGLQNSKIWISIFNTLFVFAFSLPNTIHFVHQGYYHMVMILGIALPTILLVNLIIYFHLKNVLAQKDREIEVIFESKRLISHDIKNFLNTTSLGIQLLKSKYLAELEENTYRDELLNRIEVSINSAITYARTLSYGPNVSDKEEEDALRICKKIINEFNESSIIYHKKELQTQIYEDSACLKVPIIAFSSVMYNLLDNAIKYSDRSIVINIFSSKTKFGLDIVNDLLIKENRMQSTKIGLSSIESIAKSLSWHFEFNIDKDKGKARAFLSIVDSENGLKKDSESNTK